MNPKTTEGLWLLPTKGRVTTKLPRFFKAAIETGLSTPGILIVNDTDYSENKQEYDSLRLPAGWEILISQYDTAIEKTEEAVRLRLGKYDWLGWISDDMIPVTRDWDKKCIEALNGYNCVSTDDGHQAPKNFTGATAWSGDLLRAVGYMGCPNTKHFYIDDMWVALSRFTLCWTCLMDVLVKHKNPHWNLGEGDAVTVGQNAHWDNDDLAFAKWRQNEMMPAVERINALMKSRGVNMATPDLKGRKVMIATPSGSGKYEGLYLTSFMNTWNFLKEFGAVPIFQPMPYISDVSLARDKIFGAFLRSDCTDCLMIDDDMQWKPEAVLHLLQVKKDFVAVAGPRKVSPPSFAATMNDDMGQPEPIRIDPETGFIEGALVGAAFMLISHSCAVRMAQHYADLQFESADGRTETAIFDPMIINRRRLSDDFAFCRRWKAIGGKTLVASEIPLGHVGTNVWSGCWFDFIKAKMEEENRDRNAA